MRIDPIPKIQIEPVLAPGHPSQKDIQARVLTRKRVHLFLKVCAGLFVLVFALFKEPIADAYSVLTYSGNTEIIGIVNVSGMNMKGKALFLSKSPEVINADELHSHCPTPNDNVVEYGCYVPSSNKIYILRIAGLPYSEITSTTVAHEMLHVAWEELDEDERVNVSSLLRDHINQSKDAPTQAVVAAVGQYDKDENVQIDELHSFIGSEVDSKNTDARLDAYYRKYFYDRSMSVDANERYEQGLAGIESSIASRKNQAVQQESELADYAAEWLDPIEGYMQQNIYYGDTFRYNKNVEAYNNNLKIYQSKYKNYESFTNQLNVDIASYNNAMNAMTPSKQQEAVPIQKSE
jgi:hypothetical protein